MNDLTWRDLGHGPVPTPCIGVCTMDDATQLCSGCARTTDEIGAWQGAGDPERRAIWAHLPQRRATLGLTSWRLPWTAPQVAAFAAFSLRALPGEWTLGLPGVSACFAAASETQVSASSFDVVAQSMGQALRLRVHEKTAAFAYGASARGEHPAIGLALPKGRVNLPVCDVLTPLGADADAIHAGHRMSQVFDLGLGLTAVRVSLRTGDTAVQAKLGAMAGLSLSQTAGELTYLHHADLTMIVETGLGRIETAAVPDIAALRANDTLPSGWPLHQAFLPCAQFEAHDPAALPALFRT